MRNVIFRLLFGADEIARRMCALLTLRKQALRRNRQNKRLAAYLAAGQAKLEKLKDDYSENRAALERAYRLELD